MALNVADNKYHQPSSAWATPSIALSMERVAGGKRTGDRDSVIPALQRGMPAETDGAAAWRGGNMAHGAQRRSNSIECDGMAAGAPSDGFITTLHCGWRVSPSCASFARGMRRSSITTPSCLCGIKPPGRRQLTVQKRCLYYARRCARVAWQYRGHLGGSNGRAGIAR